MATLADLFALKPSAVPRYAGSLAEALAGGWSGQGYGADLSTDPGNWSPLMPGKRGLSDMIGSMLPVELNGRTGEARMAVPPMVKALPDMPKALADMVQRSMSGDYQPTTEDPMTGRMYDPRQYEDAKNLASLLTLGAGALPAETGALRMGIKAYHSTTTPFKTYDWSKLGALTKDNVSGMSFENWATNLAKLGPWSHEAPVKNAGFTHELPVDVGGKGKAFKSLDDLERYIRKNGGPDAARQKLVDEGFGHIKVQDEEFNGLSYVSLSPDTFKVLK